MCRARGIVLRPCTRFWLIGAFSRRKSWHVARRPHFTGHPTRSVPGIEQNTGALGHGLAVAVGMALAAKLDRRSYRAFALLGDGELMRIQTGAARCSRLRC